MFFKSLFVLLASLCLMTSVSMAHDGHDDHPALDAHLSYKNGTLHLHAKFVNPPAVGSESRLVLEARDAATHQVTEIEDVVDVVLWMPSMNHGSAPTKVEKMLDARGEVIKGTYLVKNVYFVMGGDWEVRVTLTDAQAVKETQTFSLELSGGHGHH